MNATTTVKRWVFSLACFLLAGMGATAARAADAESGDDAAAEAAQVVVGRVYEIQGDLLRYIPETKDWVAVVADAPFGQTDALSSGQDGKAELIVPNQTWVRIGNSTQIQFVALGEDVSEVDVASGVARFYNKSDNGVIKATCDFGYVLANAGVVFDFYVGDGSVEVVALGGTVTFVHAGTGARYEVVADSPSLLADSRQVTSGDGTVDADWANWNAARETFWAAKTRAPVQYADCLPPALQVEAPVLEEQGQWDRVVYEGSERMFWRPTRVEAGWAPFTVGRWTEWNGDQIWIPAESFGYVTHHYGNWVSVNARWYWAPPVPVVRVRAEFPLLDVGYHWNPGRVSWIHSEGYVGWVPLAPTEVYYGHHRWGGQHTVFVSDPGFTAVVSIASLAFVSHAVVIHENDYWQTRDYDRVRVREINQTTIINNYHAAPVVNNTVINNYTTNNQRFNYTNVVVNEKPHNTVIQRIERNDVRSREVKVAKAETVQREVGAIAPRQVSREAKVEKPKMVSKMVAAGDVAKPVSEVKLPQRELKAKPIKPVATPKPAATPQVAAAPGLTTPLKPTPVAKPTATPKAGETPKPVRPPKPGTTLEPTANPKATVTPKATATPKAGETPKPVRPPKPGTTSEPLANPKATVTPMATATPKAGETPKPDRATKPAATPKAVETPRPMKAVETPKPIKPPVETPRPMKAVETPKPMKAVETPKPMKAVETPRPIKPPVETPKPMKDVETPRPMKAVETPKPMKAVETPKPMKAVETPKPLKAVETPKPMKAVETPRPIKPPVETPKPMKAVETPKPMKAAETPKPMRAVETPKPMKAVETPKPMKAVETPKPMKAVETPKPMKAVETPRPMKAAETPKPAKADAPTAKPAKNNVKPEKTATPTPTPKPSKTGNPADPNAPDQPAGN